jgi:hypothetical protein
MVASVAEQRLRPVTRRTLVLIALCAFVSRALVPQGFMPTVGADGRLSLGFCPSYGAPPAASLNHDGLARAHHAHGNGGDDGAGDRHGSCVFAASANAAPSAAYALTSSVVLTARLLPYVASQLVAPLGSVPRAQSPRAPPALT